MKHSKAFENLVLQIKDKISEIPIESVVDKFFKKEDFKLVDVREDHEWAAGHIHDATHIGRGIIERDIEKIFPDYNTPIILYCGGGYRSALAAYNLQQMGYKNVHSMQGGFRGWCDKKLPVTNINI